MNAQSRPKCVHCGALYGSRKITSSDVYWDTPNKEHDMRRVAGREELEEFGWIAISNDHPDPPAHEGAGVVVKQSKPYLVFLGQNAGKMFMRRDVWNGEWWKPYDPFCTLRCALDYARKAIKILGDRKL